MFYLYNFILNNLEFSIFHIIFAPEKIRYSFKSYLFIICISYIFYQGNFWGIFFLCSPKIS